MSNYSSDEDEDVPLANLIRRAPQKSRKTVKIESDSDAVAPKNVPIKNRKRLGKRKHQTSYKEEDSIEDFKQGNSSDGEGPIKPPPKKKPTRKATPKAKKVNYRDSSSSDESDGYEESDSYHDSADEAPIKPVPKKKSTNKGGVRVKKQKELDSDSDEDLPLKTVLKKKKATPKKKRVAVKKETGIKEEAAKKKAAPRKRKPSTPLKSVTKKVKLEKKPAAGRARKGPLVDEAHPVPTPKELFPDTDRYWANWGEDVEASKKVQKGDVKWTTLRHNGLWFPPAYEPCGVPLVYDGKDIHLGPESEELALFYAQMLETDYAKSKIFNTNFFTEFKQMLKKHDKEAAKTVKAFSKCNFQKLHALHKERVEARKAMSKEQKAELKARRDKETQHFGFCYIDEMRTKLGNFRVEPPGLFRGRGEHPKAGVLKRRVYPEDVTLNMDPDAPKPPCPMEGHSWGAVVHENTGIWTAKWGDSILNSTKYVLPAAGSSLRGRSDFDKYQIARKLKLVIGGIRERYTADMSTGDVATRRQATAAYLIDKLALRAGGEKDLENEADTVGCCNLRKEHVQCLDNNQIRLEFLGKDSIKYDNTASIAPEAWKNIKLFTTGRGPSEPLFGEMSSSQLNNYLQALMPGLTAKVFRTFNASFGLDHELQKGDLKGKNILEKERFYNEANRTVAVQLNHQRAVPRNFDVQLGKQKDRVSVAAKRVNDLKKQLRECRAIVKNAGKDATKKEVQKVASTRKAITRAEGALARIQHQKEEKELNREISLGTSKINYNDPRITVAWCKRVGFPITKVYTKTVLEKFPWSLEAPADWRF